MRITKVINPGTPPAPKVFHAECRRCGCVFEFEVEQIPNMPGLPIPVTGSPCIPCPTCKGNVYGDEVKQ